MLHPATESMVDESIESGNTNELESITKKAKCNRFKDICNQTMSFLNPASVHDDGSSRLMSIDFLRGVGIFIMVFQHEFLRAVKFEYELE